MPTKSQKAHGIIDLIAKIGFIAEEELEKTTDKEIYAYIFGHLHFSALLVNALETKDPVKLSFDYKTAHTAYLETKQECENNEKESEEHQLSMEELYPEIFKAVDAYLASKKKKKKKE